jgi:hypothetical protein
LPFGGVQLLFASTCSADVDVVSVGGALPSTACSMDDTACVWMPTDAL